MRFLRLFKIIGVFRRFGIDALLIESEPSGRLSFLLWLVTLGRPKTRMSRGERLRRSLEALGPIFVKFGQVLSTRRDLLPLDIADELARLQDQVPPFSEADVREEIQKAYGKPIDEVFQDFVITPEASASVAQVHRARLPESAGAHEVAIKILRPNMRRVIAHDLSLLNTLAYLIEVLVPQGRRFRPREVVDEFAKHLYDELNLMREASSCAQLARNFQDSPLLLVPKVYWDFCRETVMCMSWMHGVSISEREKLIAAGVSLTALSKAGVEIFFTQVLKHGFFHADMHPGNIYVAIDEANKGKYIALDFGIVGTISQQNKHYLSQNFVSIFKQDYDGVAQAHIDAGWVPEHTRVDEFAAAIRAVCEPIFHRPLKDISFGKVLVSLFQTARRFQMEVQPELILLQKTLLNVEGLGRELDPDLDLWTTARPLLTQYLSEQMSVKSLLKSFLTESQQFAQTLPELPRLIHQSLLQQSRQNITPALKALERSQKQQNRLLKRLIWVLALLSMMLFFGLLSDR